jgi:hypothetical protein
LLCDTLPIPSDRCFVPFISDIRQFPDVIALAAYLGRLARPTWGVRGSTYHNTYIPTEAQWRGLASMDSMQAGYEAKGWTAGPHFYLALHSPNPKHDGIWQMTPPTSAGVHGVTCNSTHFGIEVVGDFQAKPPSVAQQQLLIDVIAVLHRWARLGAILNAHRDCVQRTCPGDAFYVLKPQLQQRLALALTPVPLPPDPLRAEVLPGPNGTTIHCSKASAAFYTLRGGFSEYGYPLKNEFQSTGSNNQLCGILVCERVTIKRPYGAEPVHLALQAESKARGWI